MLTKISLIVDARLFGSMIQHGNDTQYYTKWLSN